MDAHITRFETDGAQTWHRCSKCSFVAVMSWEPDYAAVVVSQGEPGVQHIAHGQTFLPDSSILAPAASEPQARSVGWS